MAVPLLGISQSFQKTSREVSKMVRREVLKETEDNFVTLLDLNVMDSISADKDASLILSALLKAMSPIVFVRTNSAESSYEVLGNFFEEKCNVYFWISYCGVDYDAFTKERSGRYLVVLFWGRWYNDRFETHENLGSYFIYFQKVKRKEDYFFEIVEVKEFSE